MEKLELTTSPEVKLVFDNYPEVAREKIRNLRRLIIETASETGQITQLEETLKWGEPSYLAKGGSTIRIDWKQKKPGQYAMYFQCTTQLVPTFKLIFGNLFTFEGKRAIVFQLTDEIPENELKICIRLGLRYHKLKHLPMLGI